MIFHQRDLEEDFKIQEKNKKNWLNTTKLLPYKSINEKIKSNPNQVWVLWNDESTRINPEFNKNSNFFNWTLSYRTKSEVYDGAYGFFNPNNNIRVDNVNMIKNELYSKHFKLRKNAILWFVSNCKSMKRINIALEISKRFPVDIYGKCDVLKNTKRSSKDYPLLNSKLKICPQGL